MRWGYTNETGVRRGIALLVAAVIVLCGATAARADVAAFDGISVAQLARALEHQPVQQRGQPNPALSASDIATLRALIHRNDPGRIWIAVVTPISENTVGQVADSLGNLINKDGVVLVVGGYNFYASTTWGDNASQILGQAVGNGTLPFAVQLEHAVLGFAKADRKAHHPTPLAASLATPKPKHKKPSNPAAQGISPSTSPSGTGTSPSATTAPSATSAAAATGTPTANKKKGGGSSTALIIVGVAIGLILLIALATYLTNARKAAELRKRERDEVHDKAKSDFTTLGDKIGELDIDQQMPNADEGGKAEYAKALDCYQEAEKRLKNENDGYDFDHALKAISEGLSHIDQAEKLFDHRGRAKELLPAQVVTRLQKLAQLHRSGALTDEEFTAEKKKLLS